MELSKDQLAEVEAFAGLFYEPDVVAVILGLDVVDFRQAVRNTDTAASQAYHRGYYLSDAKLRKAALKYAEHGSVPAHNAMMGLSRDVRLKLKK